MLQIILILIIILWLTGYIHIPFLSSILFSISSHPFTLHSLILLLLILWIISLLPGIFRLIVGVILVFWLLSVFGIVLAGGLSQILIIILIIAVAFSIF